MIEVQRERRLLGVTTERVWDLIEPAQHLPRWFSGIETAELLFGAGPGRRQRVGGRWRHRRFEIEQTVIAYVPRRLLAWKHDAERLDGRPAPRLSVNTELQIELEAAGEDVLIRLRSRQVPGNLFKSMILRSIGARQVARTLDDSLDQLAALVIAESAHAPLGRLPAASP
jgi:uncharacterized protein YndB with AHSA1/START domain